jgi:hypothetical protein
MVIFGLSEVTHVRGNPVVMMVVIAGVSAAAQQPPPRPPAPLGQDLVAGDGDRVIIESDARVQIIRRHQAMVRTIFDESTRRLILIADYIPAGATPDGNVDVSYRLESIEGTWPLGPRWDAPAAIDQYFQVSAPGPSGLGLVTPLGLVQILPQLDPSGQQPKGDPSAAVSLTFRGFGMRTGTIPPVTFDQAEQELLTDGAQMAAGAGFVGGASNGAGAVMW